MLLLMLRKRTCDDGAKEYYKIKLPESTVEKYSIVYL
jgi:hypothetical protein